MFSVSDPLRIPRRQRSGTSGRSLADVKKEHYQELRKMQQDYNAASLRLQERAVSAEEKRVQLLEAFLNRQ